MSPLPVRVVMLPAATLPSMSPEPVWRDTVLNAPSSSMSPDPVLAVTSTPAGTLIS